MKAEAHASKVFFGLERGASILDMSIASLLPAADKKDYTVM